MRYDYLGDAPQGDKICSANFNVNIRTLSATRDSIGDNVDLARVPSVTTARLAEMLEANARGEKLGLSGTSWPSMTQRRPKTAPSNTG